MTAEEVLRIEFELLKQELISEYDRKGMRASGTFADELEVKVEGGNNAKLLGAPHTLQLEDGRGATSSGATKGSPPLIEKIKQWIRQKGIISDIKNDEDGSTLAFLIARKIHREGWKREGRGGVGLISAVVTDQRMQKIIDAVGPLLVVQTVEILQRELTEII